MNAAHQRLAGGAPVDSAAIVAEHLALVVDLHALIDATTPIFDLEASPTQWDEATQLHRVLRARHRKDQR